MRGFRGIDPRHYWRGCSTDRMSRVCAKIPGLLRLLTRAVLKVRLAGH